MCSDTARLRSAFKVDVEARRNETAPKILLKLPSSQAKWQIPFPQERPLSHVTARPEPVNTHSRTLADYTHRYVSQHSLVVYSIL